MEMLVIQGEYTEDLSQLEAARPKGKLLGNDTGGKIVRLERSSLAVRNRSNKEVINGPQKPKRDFLQIKEWNLFTIRNRDRSLWSLPAEPNRSRFGIK